MGDPSSYYPTGPGISADLGAILANPARRYRGLSPFLAESDTLAALRRWLGSERCESGLKDRDALRGWLHADIARLDRVLNGYVNGILHHAAFQRLEATWRGLLYLVSQLPPDVGVKSRVLNVKWSELARDAERAIEFDQSQLFRKIYEDEFGAPGGQPFGLILCDHAVRHRVSTEYPVDDMRTLKHVSEVAAAAFAPTVASVAPELFGVDHFAALDRPFDLQKVFAQVEYVRWRALRNAEDSRFVALTMPQVLMRRPYKQCTSRRDGFVFEEDVSSPDGRGYLWGSAIYAWGGAVMRAFAQSGWFEDILGAASKQNGGGLVTDVVADCFDTDRADTVTKMLTDVVISDESERDFSAAGFIPLCNRRHARCAAFYSSQTIQHATSYDRPGPTRNAQLSTRMNLMLCVSRFAHYIKVIARDRLGSYISAGQLESDLHNWIHQYVSADVNASSEVRRKFPLRSAKVQVREVGARPGTYLCIVHLLPHLRGDSSSASVRLSTTLSAARRSALKLAA